MVGVAQAEGVAVDRALVSEAVAVCSPTPGEPVPPSVAVGVAEAVLEVEAQASVPVPTGDAEPVEQALNVSKGGLPLALLLPAALSDAMEVAEGQTVEDALAPSDAVVHKEGEEPWDAVAASALAVAALPGEAELHVVAVMLALGEGDAVRVSVTDTDTVGVEVGEGVGEATAVPVLAPSATVGVAGAVRDWVGEGV